MAYANVTNNSTDRSKDSAVSALSEYEDLNPQHQENAVEYQELAPETKTEADFVTNMPNITYENSKMKSQSKSETNKQSEQSQYEELNTINDTHTYSGLSIG